MTEPSKTCSGCGLEKPIGEFGKNKGGKFGVRSTCKTCVSIRAAAWYANNRELANSRNAKWYANNRERHNARVSAKRAENPMKWREYRAAYHAAHPEKSRLAHHVRRAKEHSVGGRLSDDIAKKLMVRQRGKCACGCGKPLGTGYHLDHRMPMALGGTNTDDNIQLLRKTCNLQKGAKHPIEFMQSKGFLL